MLYDVPNINANFVPCVHNIYTVEWSILQWLFLQQLKNKYSNARLQKQPG